MIKGVIFDFDGVIVDSEPLHYRIEKDMFSDLGFNLTEEEFLLYSGVSEKETYVELKKKYQLDIDINKFLQDKIHRFVEFVETANQISSNPGLHHLLAELDSNGIQIAIATSGTREICIAILKKLDILQCFQYIVSGADVTHTKPAPDIYLLTLKRLALSPAETLVIEDSGNGIKSAKSAGIKVIELLTQERIANPMADMTIKSLAELNMDKLHFLINQ